MTRTIYLAAPTLALLSLTLGCSPPQRTADSLSAGETAVVHLAVTSEGTLEATDVDVEEDGVDCEQEGEHEGENEGCGNGGHPAADLIAGGVADGTPADAIDVAGIAIAVPGTSPTLAGGGYWFRGQYLEPGHFTGQIVKQSPRQPLRMLGSLTAVDRHADGTLWLQLFGRSIKVDPALPLNSVQSLDEAAEADVDCQQEGENEGENAGC